MRQICMSGSMSGMWKRSYGRAAEGTARRKRRITDMPGLTPPRHIWTLPVAVTPPSRSMRRFAFGTTRAQTKVKSGTEGTARIAGLLENPAFYGILKERGLNIADSKMPMLLGMRRAIWFVMSVSIRARPIMRIGRKCTNIQRTLRSKKTCRSFGDYLRCVAKPNRFFIGAALSVVLAVTPACQMSEPQLPGSCDRQHAYIVGQAGSSSGC